MADAKHSRLFFLGFPRPGVATYVVELIKEAKKAGKVVVTDWRETNLLASRFWPARGFRPSYVRLHRAPGVA